MRTLFGFVCCLIGSSLVGAPSQVKFDQRTLDRVDDAAAELSRIFTYRTSQAPFIEIGITQIANPPVTWPQARDSLLTVLEKKPMVVPLKIRSHKSESFVLVDYAFINRSDQFEYVILKYYSSPTGELVSVDLRVRKNNSSATIAEYTEPERNRLLREFLVAAETMAK